MVKHVWVVQDLETFWFLFPVDGDVGFTPMLSKAGFFDSVEEAVDTAEFHCSAGFSVVDFYSSENH